MVKTDERILSLKQVYACGLGKHSKTYILLQLRGRYTQRTELQLGIDRRAIADLPEACVSTKTPDRLGEALSIICDFWFDGATHRD